jgi:hypothetical protein
MSHWAQMPVKFDASASAVLQDLRADLNGLHDSGAPDAELAFAFPLVGAPKPRPRRADVVPRAGAKLAAGGRAEAA